jgi:hypothetical protein
MGEVFRVENLHAVVELQKARDIRFFNQDQVRKLELPGNMAIVKPSPYTHNIVAYWERPESDIRVYALGLSSIAPTSRPPTSRPRRIAPGSAWMPCCCPSTTWRRASTARTARPRSSNT